MELEQEIREALKKRGRWAREIPYKWCMRCDTHPIHIRVCNCEKYPQQHYTYGLSRCPPYEIRWHCTTSLKEAIEWAKGMMKDEGEQK